MSDKEESKFVTATCYLCAIDFCITKVLYNLRVKDRRDFHCPNGHSQHYLAPEVDPKDAELIKLRAELVDAKTLTAKLQAELDTLKIEVELWRPREDE